MKPPVDAPTSAQSRPVTSTCSASSAFWSFSPPRETKRGGRADLEHGVVSDLLSRLVVTADEPGEHERLCLRARLRQSALDEHHVESLLRHEARIDDELKLHDDAARADQSRAVVRRPQPHDLDVSSGLRRVHHPPASEVDADVAEALEEEDVAGLHARLRHAAPGAVEGVRVVRQVDPDAAVRPAHETGAVEARLGRLATPAIRNADFVECEAHRTLGFRRRRRLDDRVRGPADGRGTDGHGRGRPSALRPAPPPRGRTGACGGGERWAS